MAKILLATLVFIIVRTMMATYRFRFQGVSKRANPVDCPSYILAIWHQNLFAGILAQTGRRHVVIVSRSRDGDPVSFLCQRLGHLVSRGSSKKGTRDKGGKEAKDEMIEVLRSGVPGAITVDGPSGPAHVVKPGIIEMARATGLPIIPYLPLPRRYWSLKSWDRFRIPKPFSRIDIHYGTPLHVPQDTPFEAFGGIQQSIADALIEIERKQLAAA
jgi:lysophospholipid acyltransferase (LPLAT)-like uncharacterized protein